MTSQLADPKSEKKIPVNLNQLIKKNSGLTD